MSAWEKNPLPSGRGAVNLETKDWVAYFILYPEGVTDETERQELKAVLVPDEYAISSWLSERVAQKDFKKEK